MTCIQVLERPTEAAIKGNAPAGLQLLCMQRTVSRGSRWLCWREKRTTWPLPLRSRQAQSEVGSAGVTVIPRSACACNQTIEGGYTQGLVSDEGNKIEEGLPGQLVVHLHHLLEHASPTAWNRKRSES